MGREARIPARFAGLPARRVLGMRVPVADRRRARLLGLALLDRREAGPGLLIPRCSCVHTFGMRFPLDLVFLDAAGRPVGSRQRVPARRVRRCRGADSVLELPSR